MSLPRDDDPLDLPPPYSGPSSPPPNSNIPASITTAFTSSITAHLSALPGNMRAAQQARSSLQASHDLDLITLLVKPISAFIDRLSDGSAPKLAELTLVPAKAVEKGWVLHDAAERRKEGEVVKVVRVDIDEGMLSSASSKKDSGGFSGYGEEEEEEEDDDGNPIPASSSRRPVDTTWWFTDEAMARRLAGYLDLKPNPTPRQPVLVERLPIRAAVEQQNKEGKMKKLFGWSRKKDHELEPLAVASASSVGGAASPALSTGSEKSGGGSDAGTVGYESPRERVPVQLDQDRVTMTVRGQEVTFRRENEMGLWETLTGFAIVVTFRLKR